MSSSASDVRAVVLSTLSHVTGRVPDELSPEQPLMESGMDSLALVGFRNAIAASLGASRQRMRRVLSCQA